MAVSDTKTAKTGTKARKPAKRAATAPVPWWLAAGSEDCPHCGGRYAYEIEVRCVDCDGPMCPVCVAWVEQRSRCPDCKD